MEAENDNEQLNSSSASSSNNSSSSNLFVNLPLLPALEEPTQLSLHPQSSPTAAPLAASSSSNEGDQQQRLLSTATDAVATMGSQQQPALSDNSVFISPLSFNNNSTPPPSSNSSSSSSSSHNLHLYHHHQQQSQHHHHSEHSPHHQHSPPPSSHQLLQQQQQSVSPPASPPQLQPQQQQQLESTLDDDQNNAIADTIDASTVEAVVAAGDDDNDEDIADDEDDTASTSRRRRLRPRPHHQQPPPSAVGAPAVVGAAETFTAPSEPLPSQHRYPTSLSLLLHPLPQRPQQQQQVSPPEEEEPKPPQSYSSSYASHFAHPYAAASHHHHHQPHHYHHYHQHTPHSPNTLYNPSFSGCSSIFGFDSSKSSSNGAAMFNNNEASVSNVGGSQTANTGTASGGHGGHGASGSRQQSHQQVDRLKLLYPNVNENETPLPRCWSPHDKCLSIGLSQNNLRVHYKGVGKQHNDAASVRTAYPIPPACGLYYFEVKIISKGKNGYMGIGLTAQQFRMNRLPGWDKQSYGYHGDDGNSFSSSGNGQSYGPTFTTGDVIGCCVNFVNNTCFYTKNGIDLGIAFRDLPTKLYPTVGLQTPGEEVDANFGQEPFKFDQIEDMMKQMRAETKAAIYDFPMPADQGDPTTLLHKMVSSYLVHNGYSQTAEAFARTTGQTFQEDLSSIQNRQKILKLVMAGKMGQAIELTLHSYPGLLEENKNLWFMLKCRQFIEMVNGSDIETSVIQSTKAYQNGKSTDSSNNNNSNGTASATTTATNNAQNNGTTTITTTSATATTTTTTNSAVITADANNHHQDDLKNCPNLIDNATSHSKTVDYLNDVEMENNGYTTNGNLCKNGNSDNHNSLDVDEDMDIDVSPSSRKQCHGIERILEFGKELSQMGQLLEKENKMSDEERQMLEDAFSLIAYSNPWSSPLGWQLCPTKREAVCTALNSAILESMQYPRRPPLDVCVGHASELLKAMAQSSLGACAFVNIEDIFPKN